MNPTITPVCGQSTVFKIAAWSVTTTPETRIDHYLHHIQRTAFQSTLVLPSGPVLYVAPDGTVSPVLPPKPITDNDRVLRELVGSLREKLLHYGDTLKIGDEIELPYGFRVRLDDDHQDRVRGGAVRTCPLIVFHRSAPRERRTLAQAYTLPGGHLFLVNHLELKPVRRALADLRAFAGVKPVDPRTIAAEMGIKLADASNVPF